MKSAILSRQLLSCSAHLRRSLSSSSKVLVEVDDKTGVAQMTLNSPPVNSLNLELLSEIGQHVKQLEKNKCRGMILTSSSKSVFCAGLDIMEMLKPNPDRLKEFWTTLQDTWLTLYGCSMPTAAAINGHSPAGGCLLATSCEYRVMLPNFTIGLNETKLGMLAPVWFMSTFMNVLPRRTAEIALTQGKMFTTEEALKVGLVDETAASKEEAIQKCIGFFKSFAQVDPYARGITKQQFRKKDLLELKENRAKDLETFVTICTNPDFQKVLEAYVQNLKKKAKN